MPPLHTPNPLTYTCICRPHTYANIILKRKAKAVLRPISLQMFQIPPFEPIMYNLKDDYMH